MRDRSPSLTTIRTALMPLLRAFTPFCTSPRTALASGVLVLLLGTSCAHPPAMPAMPPMPVQVVVLESQPVTLTSDYVAKMISRHSVTLQPQVSGVVSAVYVQSGQSVGAGAPLIQINPLKQQATLSGNVEQAAVAKAQIEQARQNLNTAIQQRQAATSAVSFNQQQYNRFQTLYSQQYISRQDLDRYADTLNKAISDLNANQAEIEAQRAAVTAAENTYQQAQAGIREQRAELGYYTIRSPFAGVVGDIPVKLGTYVQSDTALLSVTQDTRLEAHISVPAEKATDLRLGLPVQLLNPTGAVLAASSLDFISPVVDDQSQTLLVKATINSPGKVLKPNQIVNARIIWQQGPGLLVPTSAVMHLGGLDFVFVSGPDPKLGHVAHQRPVKLGKIVGPHYVVLQGLKPGDAVIISGIQKIRDGAPIIPKS